MHKYSYENFAGIILQKLKLVTPKVVGERCSQEKLFLKVS